ncbi:hypothetical protein EQM14_01680 [Caproiciproducens sp. NJN-50]|uniref:XkdQ/YqbQ family protein n=1 Tax=Caproiciproducens sp. NJN-50 TaxID=2507162 RepID=UPI000FFE2EC6|nr:hypothetical protein [Caproiciproducens sp. NJN-50]QAT48594.1 hypothetical protein EQM14_01680 [Caproiciproducens sp. NJN-50]
MLTINGEDVSEIACNVKYETRWNDGAGKFTFEYPAALGKLYPNGSTVIFYFGSVNVFYGFLFSTKKDNKKYSCTAYDQLRYFKSSNSIIRPNGTTLTSWVNTVAYDCGDRIRLGTIESTEYQLGKYLYDNKSHLDMIYMSIQDNLVGNGYWYVFRDSFGALELRDIYNLRLPIIIGDGSLAKDYEYEKSIDSDTYNFAVVAKDDSSKGVRNTYVAKDDSTIKKWGKLMIYDKVSADLNDAQLASRANRLLGIKNRETETLENVDCAGDSRVMAGNSIRVVISSIGLDAWAVVDHAVHEYKSTEHTMKLDLMFSYAGTAVS